MKRYKKLIFKISKNAYFKILTDETKNKLICIDEILNSENNYLFEYQYYLLNKILKLYKIFDRIKENKKIIKIPEIFIDCIDFKKIETELKIKLYFYSTYIKNINMNDCITYKKYQIKNLKN